MHSFFISASLSSYNLYSGLSVQKREIYFWGVCRRCVIFDIIQSTVSEWDIQMWRGGAEQLVASYLLLISRVIDAPLRRSETTTTLMLWMLIGIYLHNLEAWIKMLAPIHPWQLKWPLAKEFPSNFPRNHMTLSMVNFWSMEVLYLWNFPGAEKRHLKISWCRHNVTSKVYELELMGGASREAGSKSHISFL